MANTLGKITNTVTKFGKNWSLENTFNGIKEHIKSYFVVEDNERVIDLYLDIIGEETLTADSDVTDHYVESNEAYQDQISLKPKIYTINGEIGELVWYQKDSTSQVVGQVAQKLEGVASFLGVRSKSFNQMRDKAIKIAQWVDTASNAIDKLSMLAPSVFGNDEEYEGSRSRQAQMYIYLCGLRDGRKPITINSPWGMLKNYVITNIKLTQPKETADKTLITIVFKEFRTVSIQTVRFDENKYQANAAIENQPKVDNGKTSGVEASVSERKVEEKKETNKATKKEESEVCEDIDIGEDRLYTSIWKEQEGKFTVIDQSDNTEVLPSERIYNDIVWMGVVKCNDKFGLLAQSAGGIK